MQDKKEANVQETGLNENKGWGASRWTGLRAGCALIAAVLTLLPGMVGGVAAAQIAARITAPIRSDQMRSLKGTVSPRVALAKDQGALPGGTPIVGMSLVFRRSAAQQADLAELLKAQQTKGSPMYHHWLAPGEFAARYGVSPADLSKVAGWLQAQGFQVGAIPPDADRIEFSGTAAQVNAAFRTEMHRYLLQGQRNWANSTEVSVPAAIAPMTIGIEHLNTFRPRPHFLQRRARARVRNASSGLTPSYTVTDQNGNNLNLLAPADSATIYNVNGLYSRGITGKGATIAIAGQTDITQYQSDIANFRSLSGLNASNMPSQILVPNSGTAQAYVGDLEEADIDVEWSGAIAKDASIVYVTVGNDPNMGVFDALQYAIQTPLMSSNTKFIPVISISYGNCEQAFAGSSEIATMEQVLQQANAQGQTVIASSGDSGSADCDLGYNSNNQIVAANQGLAVDYPGSSQYVTAAGGTSFSGDVNDQAKYWSTTNSASNESALSYIPETTWNNTPDMAGLNSAGSLSAGGGGASNQFSKPSWQSGPGVPLDGHRDVPDLSLSADPSHDGYVLCTDETNSAGTALTGTSSCVYPVGSSQVPYFDANNSGNLYGGTSIVAPQLAAMVALWNQEAGNTGVGNANPILYLSAQENTGAFHDVTTGSNAVVCQQGSPDCNPDPAESGNYILSCCNAGSGYDLATGLGSVDATALGAIWPGISASNAEFSLLSNPGAVSVNPGGTTNTTLVLSPSNGFSGAVALTCSGLPAGTSCSFSPGASVNLTSGAAQNVTLTISATSSAHLLPPSPFHRNWPAEAVLAGIFGFSLLGIGRRRRLFPAGWMAVLLLVTGLFASAALTACSSGTSSSGGGSTPPPAQKTTTVTVTGTSGSTTASAQVQLTVT